MVAVIFDLDNCLADAREIGTAMFAPVFDAVRRANDGSVPDAEVEEAFRDIWTHAFDWVARRHHFTPGMFDAGWKQFSRIAVDKPMQGYGDLHLLNEVPGEKFLVTSGFRLLQESKVRALGIAAAFREIHIDAIDEPGRIGKKGLFQSILTRYGYSEDEVVVVGDNPESELAAGRDLGLRTIQTLRPGVARTDDVTFHVDDLSGLIQLLKFPERMHQR